MPLSRFVFLIAGVIAAAGLTVWVATSAGAFAGKATVAVPLLLLATLGLRAIAARFGRKRS